MNERELIKLFGEKEYNNLQALSQKHAELVKDLAAQIPIGVEVVSVKIGQEADDFVKNEVTAIFKYKIKNE